MFHRTAVIALFDDDLTAVKSLIISKLSLTFHQSSPSVCLSLRVNTNPRAPLEAHYHRWLIKIKHLAWRREERKKCVSYRENRGRWQKVKLLCGGRIRGGKIRRLVRGAISHHRRKAQTAKTAIEVRTPVSINRQTDLEGWKLSMTFPIDVWTMFEQTWGVRPSTMAMNCNEPVRAVEKLNRHANCKVKEETGYLH